MIYKELLFKKLVLIGNEKKKQFTRLCLLMAPDYFWTVPASSSSKYHPSFAAGEGGLVRHTLAAIEIAEELFPAYPHLSRLPHKDDILVALFLHDTLKRGVDNCEYTRDDHPFTPTIYYQRYLDVIGYRDYKRIMSYIATHMGIWTPGGRTPARKWGCRISPAEFVHLCDYLASRKGLERIFRGENLNEHN
ncbi:MAG: hypothetical protein QXO71_11535 [Candidatus Jordarchaeaceae archaeon]